MTSRRTWALALAACLLPGGALAAQGESGRDASADAYHRNDCRLAHQVLTHGQPAGKRAWALATAPGCGAGGGEALAAALLARRDDAAHGVELEALVRAGAGVSDGSVFRAGLQLGADPGAGAAARVAGWRTVLFQLVPGTYTEFAAEDGERAGALLTAAPFRGAPLPADRLEAARTAVDAALNDAVAPPLRDALERVRAAVAMEEEVARLCGPSGRLTDAACRQALDAADAGR